MKFQSVHFIHDLLILYFLYTSHLIFKSFQNWTLQTSSQFLWELLDISPAVRTTSVRMDGLSYHSQDNNGFAELRFMTTNIDETSGT